MEVPGPSQMNLIVILMTCVLSYCGPIHSLLLANICFLLLLWWKSLVKVVAVVLLVENFHRKDLKIEEQGEGETSELTEREKE